jgi:hypothetical protein
MAAASRTPADTAKRKNGPRNTVEYGRSLAPGFVGGFVTLRCCVFGEDPTIIREGEGCGERFFNAFTEIDISAEPIDYEQRGVWIQELTDCLQPDGTFVVDGAGDAGAEPELR